MVLAVLNPWTKPGVTRTTKPMLQVVRSCLLFGSTLLNFLAVRYLQLAETTSITFMTPLIVALLAMPILGERIGAAPAWRHHGRLLRRAAGDAPGLGGMHPAALFSVAGCFCYGLYAILTRMLAAHRQAGDDARLFRPGRRGGAHADAAAVLGEPAIPARLGV